MSMKQHALSAIFPELPADELQALAADIKANGLIHPIKTYQGEVLDGWNRLKACEIAGVTPRFIEYKGNNPKSVVRSSNCARRHLTAGQRALAEVQIAEWAPAGNQPKGAKLRPPSTVAEMASNAGTSERIIQQAKQVESGGTAEVKEAVKQKEIAVDKAAAVAKKPKREQAKALAEAKEKKPKKPKAAKPVPDVDKKFAKLQEDYDELKENRDELADELKTCEAIRTGDLALEMKKLREHLKNVTRRRDELMANAVEMRKTLKYWEGQAKKLGWKPAKK